MSKIEVKVGYAYRSRMGGGQYLITQSTVEKDRLKMWHKTPHGTFQVFHECQKNEKPMVLCENWEEVDPSAPVQPVASEKFLKDFLNAFVKDDKAAMRALYKSFNNLGSQQLGELDSTLAVQRIIESVALPKQKTIKELFKECETSVFGYTPQDCTLLAKEGDLRVVRLK